MAATYEPIATTTLSSNAASITFSSIPATYTDLRIIVNFDASISANAIYLRFNSDTASNYSRTILLGNGTNAISGRSTSITYIPLGGTAAVAVLYTVDIFSYAGSTYKTCLSTNSMDNNGSGQVNAQVGLWRSTSAITSIQLDTVIDLPAGTTATLYGILKA